MIRRVLATLGGAGSRRVGLIALLAVCAASGVVYVGYVAITWDPMGAVSVGSVPVPGKTPALAVISTATPRPAPAVPSSPETTRPQPARPTPTQAVRPPVPGRIVVRPTSTRTEKAPPPPPPPPSPSRPIFTAGMLEDYLEDQDPWPYKVSGPKKPPRRVVVVHCDADGTNTRVNSNGFGKYECQAYFTNGKNDVYVVRVRRTSTGIEVVARLSS